MKKIHNYFFVISQSLVLMYADDLGLIIRTKDLSKIIATL